jgi:hypothetical protein
MAIAIQAVFLNPSMIPSEKITRQNLHVSDPPFFTMETFPFVIQSVITNENFPW